jgi:HPt (histidine-containing phosphotransfer) domain-containing protein
MLRCGRPGHGGSSDETDLPELPGIDRKIGLLRVGGNSSLYWNLMQRFVTDQGETSSSIQKALDERDRTLAERLAHTAKGVSGSLGATQLQELAATLESAINKEDQNSIEQALPPFAKALSQLVNAISEALSKREANTQPASLVGGWGTVVPILSKLRELVADDDGAVRGFFLENHDYLIGVVPDGDLLKLKNHLQAFDFEEALTVLDNIISNAGTVEKKDVGPLLKKLHEMVVDDDGRAVKQFREFRDALASGLPVEVMEKLENALQEFDFDEAKVILEEVL